MESDALAWRKTMKCSTTKNAKKWDDDHSVGLDVIRPILSDALGNYRLSATFIVDCPRLTKSRAYIFIEAQKYGIVLFKPWPG